MDDDMIGEDWLNGRAGACRRAKWRESQGLPASGSPTNPEQEAFAAKDSFGHKEEFSHDAKLMPRHPVLFLFAFFVLVVAAPLRSAEPAAAPSLITAGDLFNLKQL